MEEADSATASGREFHCYRPNALRINSKLQLLPKKLWLPMCVGGDRSREPKDGRELTFTARRLLESLQFYRDLIGADANISDDLLFVDPFFQH